MKNKSRIYIYPLIILGLILMLTNSCKKKVEVPALTTSGISDITKKSATCGGDITSDGGSQVTMKGVCWGKEQTPTFYNNSKTLDGTGTGIFASTITGLKDNATYYVRAYAINSAGIGYGNAIPFTTVEGMIPVLTTSDVSNIAFTTVTCGGDITSADNETVTERGVCWSEAENPTTNNNKTTDGTGTGSFISEITGLKENTAYFVRAYATNVFGTGYGSSLSFTTLQSNAVYDIDGNAYFPVTIGTQVWLIENLKVTHYRNGDPIPIVADSLEWIALTTGAMCYMHNDEANKTPYGGLYNSYAVNDSRNIAPEGWHVSTDDEWVTLQTFLGGGADVKNKIKATTLWESPYGGGTNESGFTAFGGGYREKDGSWQLFNNYSLWWTSDQTYWLLADWFGSDNQDIPMDGMSVRCVQDPVVK